MFFSDIDFNPRSPCGERLFQTVLLVNKYQFQSTLPLRGATLAVMVVIPFSQISIHAPLAGSDSLCVYHLTVALGFQSTLPLRGATFWFCPFRSGHSYFNPRSPCGERPYSSGRSSNMTLFQSTLPLRGAT